MLQEGTVALMVSVLVPGSSSPGSSPGRGQCIVLLHVGKTPLSTQEYKWVQRIVGEAYM